MKFKEGQEVWVKGVVDEDGDIVFRSAEEEFLNIIYSDYVNKYIDRTDEKPTIPKHVAEYIIA